MAGIQQLIFDIVARDAASPAFAKLSAQAQAAGGNVSDLSKRIDELGRRSAEARVGLAGDKEAQARLDRLDATLLTLTHRSANPSISIEGAARAAAEIAALDLELDKLGKKGGSAGAATSAVGTGGLAGPSGMGALIAAGVALTPVLITLGTGLAGLGLAAAGTAAPVLKAAQATGGLSANMHKLNPEQQALALSLLGLGQQYHQFQLALQPQVFGVFNQGIQLAGQLMHDVQPVAAATGTAFQVFLAQFGATLQDPQWRQFWAFMAATAPQDMRALGGLVIDLSNDIAILAPKLQGLAMATLQLADGAAKAAGGAGALVGAVSGLAGAAVKSGTAVHEASKGFDAQVAAWTDRYIPGARSVNGWLTSLQHSMGLTGTSTDKTAGSMLAAVAPAQSLAMQLHAAALATTALMTVQQTALGVQTGYGSSLVTTANDAQALRDKLKLSGDQIGLQTQKQRDSFGAANTYITDLGNTAVAAVKSGHGVDAAITAISTGLPVLDSAKTKNKAYWLEVQTLVGWLDKLRAEKAIQESILVSGTGRWSVSNFGMPGGQGHAVGAAGMLVSGGTPGRDSVPILAMPGEALVPTRLVPMLAPFLRAQGVPGFAAGGVVGSYAGNVAGLGPWASGELTATTSAIAGSVAAAVVAGIQAAQSGGVAGPGGGNPLTNAMLAISLYHPSAAQFAAWNYVAMRESGWSQFARNASSGAYGIPQALPESKLPFAGTQAGGSNPMAQITWMWNYMQQRYGGPFGAAAHEAAFNWYDGGGSLLPGLSLNTTGRKESVLGSRAEDLLKELIGAVQENTDVLAGLLAQNNSLTASAPATTGASLGAALAGGARSAAYRSLYP